MEIVIRLEISVMLLKCVLCSPQNLLMGRYKQQVCEKTEDVMINLFPASLQAMSFAMGKGRSHVKKSLLAH